MKKYTTSQNGLAIDFYQPFPGKPVIVFLHDSLGCIELWRDFPRNLADAAGCNALVYDRLGYGKSAPMLSHERPVNYMEKEADVLHELLTELNIKEAILFGHSDGGTIALIAASKYPQAIKAVIAEAAHIFVEEITLKGIAKAKEDYQTTNLAQKLKKYHGDKVETLFKAWTETWTRADFRDWNIEALLPDIHCPLLFIQGTNDEFGSMKQVDKTIKLVSGKAHKFIFQKTGHTPHKETPRLVLFVANDFIKYM